MIGKSTAPVQAAASAAHPRFLAAASFLAALTGVRPAPGGPPAATPAVTAAPTVAASSPPTAAPAPPSNEDRPIADPPPEPTPAAIRRAKELFNEGAAFVQKGDLHAAFRAFRGSYEQDGGADSLANMAVIEKALGRSRAAAEHLDAAMTKLPAAQAGKLDDLKLRLADICKDITVLDLRVTSTGTQVYVDEHWLGASPMERTIYLDVGEHLVLVQTSTGKDIRRRFAATQGGKEKVALGDAEIAAALRVESALAPVAAPAPVAEGSRATPWIVGGLGLSFLALGGAGLGVYLRAHEWRTKIDSDTQHLGGSCSPPTPGFVDDCRARDQEARNETAGMVLGIAGGVGAGGLAIGGLMVWITSVSPPAPANSAKGAPALISRVSVAPTLGGLVVQGQF